MENQRVNKTFSLSVATMDELYRYSERTNIPMSRIIDMAVKEYFDRHGDKDE